MFYTLDISSEMEVQHFKAVNEIPKILHTLTNL